VQQSEHEDECEPPRLELARHQVFDRHVGDRQRD
jgi:hypothetical protein